MLQIQNQKSTPQISAASNYVQNAQPNHSKIQTFQNKKAKSRNRSPFPDQSILIPIRYSSISQTKTKTAPFQIEVKQKRRVLRRRGAYLVNELRRGRRESAGEGLLRHSGSANW